MEQLQKTVGLVANACQSADGGAAVAPQDAAPASEETPTAPAAQPVQYAADWRSVQVTSRADAQLMLEKAKQYFAQHEPSHPAPLMIDRVQKLIELNFMDIIRDLAPDGVHQLENIFGRRD